MLLRQHLRHILHDVSIAARQKKSLRIIQTLLRKSFYKKASVIVTYVSLPAEVDTKRLIKTALKQGKRVYVPCVHRRSKTMTMAPILDFEKDLVPGAYGILEPKKRLQIHQKDASFDIIFAPGLGFDREGRRLGRGAGYFDRFLKQHTKALKVGLAFREQIVKRVPTLAHDQQMDCVITD